MVADGNGNAYLQITCCTESNLIGSCHGSSVTLLAADYFARGKTDAKSIVGMKRIAKRNYLNFKWILIVFFCCVN